MTHEEQGDSGDLRVDPSGPEAWRNWRAARAGLPEVGAFEAALYSDVPVAGELWSGLGPYALLNTVAHANAAPTGGLPNLAIVVRASDHLPDNPGTVPMDRTDFSAYHGGDDIDEIAALLSLALGVRFRSGGITRVFRPLSSDPRGMPSEWEHSAPYLPPASRRGRQLPRSPIEAKIVDAASLLASYPDLDSTAAVALTRAARQYQMGLWIAESDPAEAWLRLVGAIEAGAQLLTVAPRDSVSDLRLGMPALADECDRAGGAEHLSRVADQLVHLTRATRKFVEFLMTYLPPPPTPRPPEAFQLDWTRMRNHVRSVYEWRSRALHDGVPFPAAMCMAPVSIGDAPVEATFESTATGRSVWTRADAPMLLGTFEHIARGALLRWWATLAESVAS